jgi:hypothetical protein
MKLRTKYQLLALPFVVLLLVVLADCGGRLWR